MGYAAIPERLSMKASIPRRSRLESDRSIIREVLTALGYYEVWTDSLIDPAWPQVAVFSDAPAQRLMNPLRSDHAALRNSLLPSLLAVRKTNQDSRATRGKPLRIFEIGRVYLPRRPGARDEAPPLYEPWVLGILDERGPSYVMWAIGEVLAEMGISQVRCSTNSSSSPPWCAPGRGRALVAAGLEESKSSGTAAEIWGGSGWRERNGVVGYYGEVNPELLARMDMKGPCATGEINISILSDDRIARTARKFTRLPRFPEIARDVAMVVDENVTWGDVLEFFRAEAAEPLIKEPPRFLSAYRGKQVGAGKKSLAFSLVYRHEDRTLTDEEVNEAHGRVVERLLRRFRASLRM